MCRRRVIGDTAPTAAIEHAGRWLVAGVVVVVAAF